MYNNKYASGGYDFSNNLKYQALIDLGRKSNSYTSGGYDFSNNLKYQALIDLMREK